MIPAIDILGGRCVRLWQGDFEQSTTYSDDPASLSVDFERAGALRVHVVDLDAARSSGDNRAVVEAVIARSGLSVQVAGGMRPEQWAPAATMAREVFDDVVGLNLSAAMSTSQAVAGREKTKNVEQ